MNVEVLGGKTQITSGRGVRVGALTRIFLNEGAQLQLGSSINLGRDVHLQSSGAAIRIGDGSSIQDHCRIYGDVTIGRSVIVAPNVFVSAGTHTFQTRPHCLIVEQEQLDPLPERPIVIGDDCWLGVNVVVMPGVTIGKGCIIAANAVVTKDIAPYSVVAGAPAAVRKRRLDFEPPERITASRLEDLPYFYSGFDYRQRHAEYGYPMDASGVLALASPRATWMFLKLYVSGVAAHFRYEGQTYPLHNGWNELCVPLASKDFHPINVEGACRLAEAYLQHD
jgi:acetyltransferase-like isoleucine patch superfamily enzyme